METRPKIAVVGSINIDYVAQVAALPVPGETVSGGEIQVVPGGKGANQAVAAAKLGAAVSMVSAVGDDAAGQIALDSLAAAGVDTSGVRRAAGLATGTALIMVDAPGENMIAVCDGANHAVRVEPGELDGFDAVMLQLEIPMSAVQAAAAACDGYLAVNAAPAIALPQAVIDRADLIIVNETELAELPAASLIPGLVAVTLGAHGAQLLRRGEIVAQVSSPKAKVVNSVGAGDAFCAALTLGLVRGTAPEVALAAACAVGAAAVEDPRSQPDFAPLGDYTRQ